jgi:hypothetical protein
MIIYYINLENAKNRNQQIVDDFTEALPENYYLQRWEATKHCQGWIGCIQSHMSVLQHALKNNPNNDIFIIMEDDCKLRIPKSLFKSNFPRYIEYLKKHKNDWDVFVCGGINPIPTRIISKDPFIIECSWITCAHFNIHSRKSAESVINYGINGKYDVGIDNHIARSHRNRIWVPYPMIAEQYNNDTSIGNYKSYLPTIINEFKKSIEIFNNFVANCG